MDRRQIDLIWFTLDVDDLIRQKLIEEKRQIFFHSGPDDIQSMSHSIIKSCSRISETELEKKSEISSHPQTSMFVNV